MKRSLLISSSSLVLKLTLVICFSLSVATQAANAQSNLQTDLPLAYLVKAPADTEEKPLIIFLHGYGSNAADLFELKTDLPTDAIIVSAQGPTTAPGSKSGYQWFPVKFAGGDFDIDVREVDKSTGLIKDFVSAAISKFKTKPEKTILIGFSQGAVMTYEVGLRNPAALAGIVALGSRMSPLLIKDLRGGKKLGKLKVFIGHGVADRTLLLSGAVEARKAIEAAGSGSGSGAGASVKPEFHAYPGLAHGISPAEMKDVRAFVEKTLR